MEKYLITSSINSITQYIT